MHHKFFFVFLERNIAALVFSLFILNELTNDHHANNANTRLAVPVSCSTSEEEKKSVKFQLTKQKEKVSFFFLLLPRFAKRKRQ